MKNKILFPNCSEIIWKLDVPLNTREKIIKALENSDEEIYGTSTDTYPNSCVEDILVLLENKCKKDLDSVKIVCVDNKGGGGDWGYVEDCLKIAKAYLQGKIKRKRVDELEQRSWNSEEIYIQNRQKEEVMDGG